MAAMRGWAPRRSASSACTSPHEPHRQPADADARVAGAARQQPEDVGDVGRAGVRSSRVLLAGGLGHDRGDAPQRDRRRGSARAGTSRKQLRQHSVGTTASSLASKRPPQRLQRSRRSRRLTRPPRAGAVAACAPRAVSRPGRVRVACGPASQRAVQRFSYLRAPEAQAPHSFGGLSGLPRSRAVAAWKSIGAPGFEPGTSPTRTARATRLRHAPMTCSVCQGWARGARQPGPATALK